MNYTYNTSAPVFAPKQTNSYGYNENNQFVVSIFDGEEQPYFVDLRSFQKQFVTFGRNPDNDIVLKSELVSRQHGYFQLGPDGCTLVDNMSSNGIIVNGQRIQTKLLREGDQIKIDRITAAMREGVLFLFGTKKEPVVWRSITLFDKQQISIGRDHSCDVVLDHISVSKVHAYVENTGNGFVIRDNSSLNGVYVNGIRINGSQNLHEKDVIVITNSKLLYSAGTLNYCCFTNGIGLDAIDIVKTVKSGKEEKIISNHISLIISPCSFTGIIGGSGAGKTTFMNCLCGYNKATEGRVLINGVDLYENYDSFKSIIGYVPQQDIIHGNLTLQEMLDYSAKLRMPLDTTEQERKTRVRDVINTVELAGNENTMINLLSGGQRKRASIAVELLSDPKLFFLDEPSSGLDPGTEKNLMRTMHNMARQGITIILITHTIQNINLFDKIIFLGRGGNLCYYGSPQAAPGFFGVDHLSDAYVLTDTNSEEFRQKFLNSGYMTSAMSGAPVNDAEIKNAGESFSHKIKKIFSDTATLSARYAKLLINDRQRMLLLLLQPPLLAFLISLTKDGNQYEHRTITMSILFALACSAFWIGILNAIQEICKENSILKREHMAGLSLFAYVTSKMAVLIVLCGIQSLLLMGSYSILIGLPEDGVMMAPFFEMLITVFLTMISAMALGLLVSSFFDNPDRALVVAPILIMPQILFSGILFELDGIKNTISYFTTCRWSMKSFGITTNLNVLPDIMEGDIPMEIYSVKDIFEYTASNIRIGWEALILMTVICYIFVYVSMRLKKV